MKTDSKKKLIGYINEVIGTELKKNKSRIKEEFGETPVPGEEGDGVKSNARVQKFFDLLTAKPQIMKYLNNLNIIQKKAAAAKFLNLIDLPEEKFIEMLRVAKTSRK